VVEPHPYKELMLERIIAETGVREEEILFIDDDPSIVRRVTERYKRLRALKFGEDVSDFCELNDRVGEDLGA